MKTLVTNLKNNKQRLIVSFLLLALTSPAFSQSESASDKYYTIEILSAILFVLALGVLMLVSLIKQKNRDKKKLHRYLHAQRKQSGFSTSFKY